MLRSGLLVDDFIPEDVWNLIGDSLILNRQELKALLSERLGISRQPVEKSQIHTTLNAADDRFFASEISRISQLSSATQLAIILRAIFDFGERIAALLSLCKERKLLPGRQLHVLSEVVNDCRHGVDRGEWLRRALTYLIKGETQDKIQSIFREIDRYFAPGYPPNQFGHELCTVISAGWKVSFRASAINRSPAGTTNDCTFVMIRAGRNATDRLSNPPDFAGGPRDRPIRRAT